jgi:hypothetical protein
MLRGFPTLIAVFALCTAAAVHTQQQAPPAPQPPPQNEEEQLVEEYIRTREEQGPSHASGGRPELGPVIRGNPTDAVKVLRVGLYANVGATEFGTLHHPFVELTHTDGDVKVIDQSSGKEISVITAGSLARVEHDGFSYLVSQDGVLLGAYEGPVYFRPTSRSNLFQIDSLRRTFNGSKVPL